MPQFSRYQIALAIAAICVLSGCGNAGRDKNPDLSGNTAEMEVCAYDEIDGELIVNCSAADVDIAPDIGPKLPPKTFRVGKCRAIDRGKFNELDCFEIYSKTQDEHGTVRSIDAIHAIIDQKVAENEDFGMCAHPDVDRMYVPLTKAMKQSQRYLGTISELSYPCL